MLPEDCVVMKTLPGRPSKPSCSAVAPSWLKAERASQGTTSWNCGNSSSRWVFYSSLQLTSPTCCRTWSSWGWRNCMASSVLETSTTSASKPFRCINIKHVLQIHASDTRKFNYNTNINHICIKTLQVHQHKTCFAMSRQFNCNTNISDSSVENMLHARGTGDFVKVICPKR